MLNDSCPKVVLTKVDPKAEGSAQFITPRGSTGFSYYNDSDETQDENILPDSPERSFVVYHLLRIVRDLYINSQEGGKSGAYRKQCRTKRKSALLAILNPSEEPLSFRWSCRALGFDPDTFRNRVLFDVRAIANLMRDGVMLCEEESARRKSMTKADVWSWDDAPTRYKLSQKKGHFVVKISKKEAQTWLESLNNSPLEFAIEQFEIASEEVILIARNK